MKLLETGAEKAEGSETFAKGPGWTAYLAALEALDTSTEVDEALGNWRRRS